MGWAEACLEKPNRKLEEKDKAVGDLERAVEQLEGWVGTLRSNGGMEEKKGGGWEEPEEKKGGGSQVRGFRLAEGVFGAPGWRGHPRPALPPPPPPAPPRV